MVVAAHPLAAQAGLAVLREGGNAFDAAIATAAVLTVVQPNSSHLGGDAFMLVYRAGAGGVAAINASGAAPRAASREACAASGIPQRGLLSTTVPGVVNGWAALHGRYGRLGWSRLLQPAIEYAAQGFPVNGRLSRDIAESRDVLEAHPTTARIFLKGGRVPQPGDILVQPDLAQSLRRLAAGGAAAYYQGEIAQAVARFCRENGGLLTEEDFAAHRAEVLEPICTTYRGYTVYEQPPVSQGHIVLEALNILEGLDLAPLGPGSAESIHLLVEAYRLAFADREAYAGDPAAVRVPLRGLLSKEYAAGQRARLNPARAAGTLEPGDPWPYEGDTTSFVVVDGEGNAVSFIQSIFASFGSGVVAGETGILLNNRLAGFNLAEGHPNCLAPGKRPVHTLNTYMLFRDGRLFMLGGSRGAHLQVQLNLQLITNVVDFGLDLQDAIQAPRWYSYGDELRLESRVGAGVRRGLEARGYRLTVIEPWSHVATTHALIVHPDSGALMGAADPRGAGCAAGY